jgi:hypothetical protein
MPLQASPYEEVGQGGQIFSGFPFHQAASVGLTASGGFHLQPANPFRRSVACAGRQPYEPLILKGLLQEANILGFSRTPVWADADLDTRDRTSYVFVCLRYEVMRAFLEKGLIWHPQRGERIPARRRKAERS